MEDNQSTNTEATVATETPEVDPILATLSDTEDTSTDESSTDDAVETPDSRESTEETTPEVEPTEEETEEVEPTVDPKEEAQRRYEERQLAKEQRRVQIEEAARKQADEHRSQAEDEYDQRLRNTEADNIQRDAERYAEKIENNENTLITEFERAKANPDLQIFNPDNKESFNQPLYEKAIKDYNAGYLEYDANGNMTKIKGSLFEHLTETAGLFQDAVKRGAVQQVKDAQSMKSNADTKPSAPPKEKAPDPILDILSSD